MAACRNFISMSISSPIPNRTLSNWRSHHSYPNPCRYTHLCNPDSSTNTSFNLRLDRCGSLHTLTLSGCAALTDISGLGQCGSLHTLDLSGCSELTDISGLGKCESLHTVNLSGCGGLTDVSGLGQCGSLHTLNLSSCDGLADVSGLGHCVSLTTYA